MDGNCLTIARGFFEIPRGKNGARGDRERDACRETAHGDASERLREGAGEGDGGHGGIKRQQAKRGERARDDDGEA